VIAVTFDSFESAYLAVLRHVDSRAEHTNAPRRNASRECLNVSFQIADPIARVPFLPSRRTNIVFNFAEALWFLSGRDDLAMIGYYAPRMRSYSADGVTVEGSAYGTRMFRPIEQTGRTAFGQALDLIEDDPPTKRAVMVIFRPWETADPYNPDVSCTIAFQLLLRGDELHAVCYMRANDAVQGLVSDVFSFTLIQEFAARLLGVRVGSYGHHVGSMHIGDRDAERVARVLAEHPPHQVNPVAFTLPTMPTGTSWSDLDTVLEYERDLRENRVRFRLDDRIVLGLPGYWRQVVLLFEVYRQIKYETGAVRATTLQSLDPAYRWLVAHRWPDRMPAGVAHSIGAWAS
jgi:thymidylate synthase